MSSPIHFDLTKRGSTEANILEVQESDGVENENLKNYIFRNSAQDDNPVTKEDMAQIRKVQSEHSVANLGSIPTDVEEKDLPMDVGGNTDCDTKTEQQDPTHNWVLMEDIPDS